MTLKIKDKKKLFWRDCIWTIFYIEKIWIIRVFLCIEDPDPVFSPDPDPNPGDPERPEPTGSRSVTLPNIL